MTHHPPIVLVVEDDLEMNDLECELLEVHGLESVAAFTGLEALDKARAHGPDAVLLDAMLPEMDGFETCRRLRKLRGGGPPIVMVTALDSEDCRRRGFDAGADAYFAKPFDPDDVVQTLRRLLNGTKSED